MTSSKMAANMAAILDFTKNSNLSGKLGNCKYFFAKAIKYDAIKHFATFAFYKFLHRKRVKFMDFYSKIA